jgi:acetyl esterase/lipase
MSKDTSHIAEVLPFFNILEATYKTVSSHPVECSVFLPKRANLSAQQLAHPRPVCISYHGGCYITGSRHSYEWMPVWQVERMREQAAIVRAIRE